MTMRIDLQIRMRGVCAEVGLQGAPLVRNPTGEARGVALPADLWLAPEGNLVTARVAPGDDDSVAPSLDVVLCAADEPERPLFALRWAMRAGEDFEPFELALPVPGVIPARTRLWSEAEAQPELDEAAMEGAREAGMEVWRAWQQKDVARLMALQAYRDDEVCRAMGFDRVEHGFAVTDELMSAVSEASFALVPVERDEVRVTACAGDRVFHLARGDGGELIEAAASPGGSRWETQVYVAKIEGAWRVVR